MDYKKIIKSRNTRVRLLNLFNWVPDVIMVKIQYRIKTGRRLNYKNPKRYSEKLQQYKLKYKNPIMKNCVDKYEVRNYIKSKGYENILNKCYGVYENFEEIDFNKLPKNFVIKDTLGGGGNDVIIIKDFSDDKIPYIKEKINEWLKRKISKKSVSREWVYCNSKHRIIIEEYLTLKNGDLPDYKFFCFNGKCEYFYCRTDYANNHDNGKMSFFDRKCNYLKGVGMDYCNISTEAPKLENNINEMIEISDKLSEDFPHVRVDLYNIEGKIIFGELTFFNASGYMNFIPDRFDYLMGDKFELQKYNK